MTKSAVIKQGKPCGLYVTVYELLEAIDLCDCSATRHIHEGKIYPVTGYPEKYYVCDGPMEDEAL